MHRHLWLEALVKHDVAGLAPGQRRSRRSFMNQVCDVYARLLIELPYHIGSNGSLSFQSHLEIPFGRRSRPASPNDDSDQLTRRFLRGRF